MVDAIGLIAAAAVMCLLLEIFRRPTLTRVSTAVHGIEPRTDGRISWEQYWHGIEHVWYWHGIPVWRRLRKRDRPMYEFIKLVIS